MSLSLCSVYNIFQGGGGGAGAQTGSSTKEMTGGPGGYNELTFTPKRFCTSAVACVYLCIYLQQHIHIYLQQRIHIYLLQRIHIYLQQRIHIYLLQQRIHAPSITKECAYGHFILIRICKYHITFMYAYTHVYTHFGANSLRAEPAKRAKRHNTNIHQRVKKKNCATFTPTPILSLAVD